jgi:actin related protein 2/3 complex subunit 3
LKQLREEVTLRMLDRLYNDDGSPNKWWMAFAKRKFMKITMI